MNGRSIGRTRTASAPPAATSSRASTSPGLSPRERCRSVRAPADRRVGEDVPVGADDEHVCEPAGRVELENDRERPGKESLDELLPLLRVEPLTKTALRATQRTDRHDRRDPRPGRGGGLVSHEADGTDAGRRSDSAKAIVSRATLALASSSLMIVSVVKVRSPRSAISRSRSASMVSRTNPSS